MADYDLRSSKLATALVDAGLSPNSKAGLYLNNSNEYLICQNAIFKIGGVPINVNYRYVEEELIYLLENSDSEAVFYHACYSSRIKQIAPSLQILKHGSKLLMELNLNLMMDSNMTTF